jgi:hypothetical protein
VDVEVFLRVLQDEKQGKRVYLGGGLQHEYDLNVDYENHPIHLLGLLPSEWVIFTDFRPLKVRNRTG